MAYFTALALLLLAGTCLGSKRIINGTPTTIERYPYIVQVDMYSTRANAWGQGCGANILNELYVLSAAHCFEDIPNEPYHPSFRRIRAGSTHRNSGGQLVYIVREYNHPQYRVATRFDSDISVIRLSSFMSFTPVIQPIRLVNSNTNVPDNSPVVHAGWGTTVAGVQTSASPVLLDVQIFTVNNADCRSRYIRRLRGIVTENMICAGVLGVNGYDACQGDSGGPLYYRDTNILVGVVSWGAGCGDSFLPGISAAVSPFVDWIRAIVAS